MENLTLTITPSNQDDLLTAIARKIIDLGWDHLVLNELATKIVDAIDYDDVTERIVSDININELADKALDEIDMYSLAQSVLEEIDIYSFAEDVEDHIDIDRVLDNNDVEMHIKNAVTDIAEAMIREYDDRLETLETDTRMLLDKANENIALLTRRIAELENNNKSFIQRILWWV